jgi:hypothetical protein
MYIWLNERIWKLLELLDEKMLVQCLEHMKQSKQEGLKLFPCLRDSAAFSGYKKSGSKSYNITPVNAWGAIGYGYKSLLLFLHGTRKKGAFKQTDYLVQILEPYIQGILEAFAAVTHALKPFAEPLFIENGNSAYGHKSSSNYCARWRTAHGIILMPHPSTSPDMNPIKKY